MKIKTSLQLGALVPIALTIVVSAGLSVFLFTRINQEALASVTTAMAAVFAVVSLLMGGALYVLSRTMADRIEELEANAARVRAGQLEQVSQLQGADELAGISGTFKEMVGKLQDYAKLIKDYNQVLDDHKALRAELEKTKKAAEMLRRTEMDVSDGLERLHRAQEMLVEHQRMNIFGQMFAGVLHALNEALTSIFARAELGLAHPEKLTEEVRKDYEIILASAERLRVEFRGLSDFYLMPAGMTEPVDIGTIVDEVISLSEPKWRTEAQARGATITMNRDCPQGAVVNGSRMDLTEMLMALVFNAVEAMPAGGTLTIHVKAPPGGNVMITLVDTGVGMEPEVKKRCLRPFFTTKEGAAGIGLPMASGIAQQHAGKLGIITEPGKGTTVVIDLPAATQREAPQKVQPLGEPLDKLLSILLVEDEEWTLEILERRLRSEGHTVVAVRNGADGLAKVKAQSFDIVITDRAMPRMSGDELAAAIKEGAPWLPIVLLTGFGDIINAHGVRPPNVDAVVAKPLAMGELRRVLANLMVRPRFQVKTNPRT
ncbi:MAG: response regulator [Kiritimatiellae bacterium]|nr:response regulator [Kiritimatiellia bacterium]